MLLFDLCARFVLLQIPNTCRCLSNCSLVIRTGECFHLSDLQLLPNRTDDFIPKLFYETNRFTAHGFQWTVKARVNDNQDNPIHSMIRTLGYQLVLKTRPQSPVLMSYVALKGPFGETHVDPVVYEFEFTGDVTESPYQELPLPDSVDCNRMLAAKHINLRFALVHK